MRIGHASIDEHNKISGGNAGDQTSKEVCIRSYYDKNWNFVLRPRNPDIAEKTAKACELRCNNNHIGYDQNQRNTLLTLLESLKWDYTKITQNTECDCSSFMTACAICGGAKIKYKGNAPTTRTMVAKFKESGYYEAIRFTNPKHTGLKRGDILVKEGSHTAMVLDDYVPTNSITDNKPTIKLGDKNDWVTIAQGRLVVNGYKIEVDGDFGQKTRQAVIQYQKDNGLVADGIIGSKTWEKLYS